MPLKIDMKDYTYTIFFFGCFLLIFFSCIVGSINECDKTCNTINKDLNTTGFTFGVIGIFVAFVIMILSAIVINRQGYKLFDKYRLFGGPK